jgi:TonB family protein
MNPDDRGGFRRNLLLIALLHVLVLGGLWLFATWRNRPSMSQQIAWLDGGGLPVGGQDAQPSPADTPEEDETPSPTPGPTPMATPAAEPSAPPSELVIATPAPVLVSVPTPEPTATPEPTVTPTPEPTATPRPRPRISPKPRHHPKASPSAHKHSSPRPSPHRHPSATPSDQDSDNDNNETDADKAAKAAFKKATGHAADTDSNEGGASGDAGTAPGSGGGHRGGAGHAGGGATESDFGWYHAMLHDRFYSRWIQPTSIVTATSSFSTIVKIRIEKDGTISDVSLAQSSGNDVMDQSVMEAARRVTQVDPLPEGLGNGGAYEVKINFELSQQSQ